MCFFIHTLSLYVIFEQASLTTAAPVLLGLKQIYLPFLTFFFLGHLFGAAEIPSINRTCRKSEFNRILLEKRTQRNPALCEFAFLVSIVYARKHCILKEVGYHVNIDLFFSAVIWSTNSSYSKYFFSRYYTLLFDISSSSRCIYWKFFIKKRYFYMILVTFGLGGYPLEKGSKKVPKC